MLEGSQVRKMLKKRKEAGVTGAERAKEGVQEVKSERGRSQPVPGHLRTLNFIICAT